MARVHANRVKHSSDLVCLYEIHLLLLRQGMPGLFIRTISLKSSYVRFRSNAKI